MKQRACLFIFAAIAAAIGVLTGCASPAPRVSFPPPPQYPAEHEYTLDELVQLSVYRNAGLDVARYEAEAAQGLVDQVKSLWLPQLRYDFLATAYDNDLSYETRAFDLATLRIPLTGTYNIINSLSLTQILYSSGKRTSGLKQARMYAAIKQLEILRLQDKIAYDVATYYQLVCVTDELDRILEDAERRVKVFRQLANELVARGTLRGNRLDGLLADFFVSQIEQLRAAIQGGRQQAYMALRQAVGVDFSEPLLLKSTALPPAVTLNDLAGIYTTMATGFVQRPENQQVNLFAKLRAEQTEFAKKGFQPNIAFVGTATDTQGSGNSILGAVDGIIAGLVVDVPLYDPVQRGKLREALGLERASAAFQKQVEQLIGLEIEVTSIEAHKALANVLKSGRARRTAAENYEATREAYSRELVPANAVVTAIAIDMLAKAQDVQAQFAFLNARAALRRVTADRESPHGY